MSTGVTHTHTYPRLHTIWNTFVALFSLPEELRLFSFVTKGYLEIVTACCLRNAPTTGGNYTHPRAWNFLSSVECLYQQGKGLFHPRAWNFLSPMEYPSEKNPYQSARYITSITYRTHTRGRDHFTPGVRNSLSSTKRPYSLGQHRPSSGRKPHLVTFRTTLHRGK